MPAVAEARELVALPPGQLTWSREVRKLRRAWRRTGTLTGRTPAGRPKWRVAQSSAARRRAGSSGVAVRKSCGSASALTLALQNDDLNRVPLNPPPPAARARRTARRAARAARFDGSSRRGPCGCDRGSDRPEPPPPAPRGARGPRRRLRSAPWSRSPRALPPEGRRLVHGWREGGEVQRRSS